MKVIIQILLLFSLLLSKQAYSQDENRPTWDGIDITTHPDYGALEAFYLATDGMNWDEEGDWLVNPDLNTWTGISTNDDGRVSDIFLSSSELNGTIPKELGELDFLTTLVLISDSLKGTIPKEIGNLTSLTELWLAGEFSGPIPEELSDLVLLEGLIIVASNLSGNIPSSFSSLINLKELTLSGGILSDNTGLTGDIGFSGEIPDIFQGMSKLESLSLSHNQLTGTLPASIATLPNLTQLILTHNQLAGLPDLTPLGSIEIHIVRNELTFEDIVPNAPVLSSYSPQNYIGEEHIFILDEGESITLEVVELTGGNTYQWFKNGVEIEGATEATLHIPEFSEIAAYYYEVKNPAAPELTLRSQLIYLYFDPTPTDIVLSNYEIEENNSTNFSIATISAVNDHDYPYTYKIESSENFSIGGNFGDELIANTTFDFEVESSFTVEITAQDILGNDFKKELIIDILDANDPPTDINLSNDITVDGKSAGQTIGTFSVVDQDAMDTFTFSLGGPDSESFRIGGIESDELQNAQVFDADIKNSYTLDVTVTDSGGLEVTKEFTITIEPAPLVIDDKNDLVSIYPNPSDGTFSVILDKSLINPSWSIIDIGGKDIDVNEKIEIQNNIIFFEIGDLRSGVYLLNINAGAQNIVNRIVIE
ncbi:T9SS type A sorting domain-containing protein [Ekhidna sp.]